MTEREREIRTPDNETERKRESDQLGGGQDRVDEVGRLGVYPASGHKSPPDPPRQPD